MTPQHFSPQRVLLQNITAFRSRKAVLPVCPVVYSQQQAPYVWFFYSELNKAKLLPGRDAALALSFTISTGGRLETDSAGGGSSRL